MKKLIAMMISLALILSCVSFACAESTSYKIGICNYVDDASLNQIVDNIRSQLSSVGAEKGVNFEILYDNCNADANVMAQIIANFQSENMHTKTKAEITRDTTQKVNLCIIGQTKTKKYSPQSNVYEYPVPRFYRFMKNVGVQV